MKKIIILFSIILLNVSNIKCDYVKLDYTIITNKECEEIHDTRKINKNEFLELTAMEESSKRYGIANRLKYVGKWQFGKIALLEVAKDYPRITEEYIDSLQSSVYMVEKNGKKVYKFDLSLFPPSMQDKVACLYFHRLEKRYMRKHINKYVGTYVDGVYITKAGILSASLLGHKNVMDFLDRNGKNPNFKDSNGTSIKSRLVHYEDVELDTCF